MKHNFAYINQIIDYSTSGLPPLFTFRAGICTVQFYFVAALLVNCIVLLVFLFGVLYIIYLLVFILSKEELHCMTENMFVLCVGQ